MNTGRVVDPASNLADDPSLPVTSKFDEWFRLFGSYTGERNFKGARGGPGWPGCENKKRKGKDETASGTADD